MKHNNVSINNTYLFETHFSASPFTVHIWLWHLLVPFKRTSISPHSTW